MTFSEVVEALRRSGVTARRKSWPAWRHIYVPRKSSALACYSLAVKLKEPDPNGDDAAKYGLARWQPLLRDLVATDWLITRAGER